MSIRVLPIRILPISVLPLVVMTACGRISSDVCETFADRDLGITGAEYRPCAGAILVELDSIQPKLEALVAGDRRQARGASSSYRALRSLVEDTGIFEDYRSMRPSTVIVKWPEASTREFNSAAFDATNQYGAVLAHPNEDNLRQGVEAHEVARRAYARIR
ncbi:MAG TPA: hypothetical protein VFH11_08550 [Gemmatimonadota bacterium]|nr:hypothetical protein [Gemmatimonadota bacterium]